MGAAVVLKSMQAMSPNIFSHTVPVQRSFFCRSISESGGETYQLVGVLVFKFSKLDK